MNKIFILDGFQMGIQFSIRIFIFIKAISNLIPIGNKHEKRK